MGTWVLLSEYFQIPERCLGVGVAHLGLCKLICIASWGYREGTWEYLGVLGEYFGSTWGYLGDT